MSNVECVIEELPGEPYRANPEFIDSDIAYGSGYFILEKSAALAARNYVAGKSPGSIQGAPVYSADRVAFNATAYLNTGIIETTALTWIVAARSPEAMPGTKDICIMSSRSGPSQVNPARTSFGTSLQFDKDTGNVRLYNARWNGTTAVSGYAILGDNEAKIPPGSWTLFAVRVDAFGATLQDLTRGASATYTAPVDGGGNPTAIRDPANAAIFVGSQNSATTDIGTVEIALVSMYPWKLSDAELVIAAAEAREHTDMNGISGV